MNQLLDKKQRKIKSKLDKKFSTQFLPECLFDLSKIEYFHYKEKKLKSAYTIDIVHNLILKYYFKKDNSYNLSSLILKDKYGYLYNYYISYLIDNDILKLIRNHSKGKNSRIYKLNESIFKKPITRYKNFDKIILKKIKKVYTDILNKETSSNLIFDTIKLRLVSDLYHVKIDYAKSIFFLDSSIQETDIYHKNKYSVESIKDGNIFYHFDNYGRFHTNFTILKSFIRKNCLLIDGEGTSEIDIKNSQPLFLSQIILSHKENLINQEELELYNYLTKNGVFYQYLQEKFSIKDKKILKEMIYKVFFGKNYPNKLDKSFKQIFPTIYYFIKEYKKKNGDYRYLSYQLQRTESNFLFNRVVKEIYDTYDDVKIITCHDSIICKKSDEQKVLEIFNHLLTKEFEINLHNDYVFNI